MENPLSSLEIKFSFLNYVSIINVIEDFPMDLNILPGINEFFTEVEGS